MEKESLVDIHPLIRDRIRGCLFGIAIGDALGAPFEGLRPGMEGHDQRLAGGRITDFHPRDGLPPGTWTDDTSLTLCACVSFIIHERGFGPLETCFWRTLKDWSTSPGARKVGHTVYHAAKYGTPDENSWANGALMRIAPVAIYAYLKGYNQEEAAQLAMFIARLTHGHPLATLPAVECVLALMSILSLEKNVPEHISRPWEFLPQLKGEGDQRMEDYKKLRHNPLDHIHPTAGLWMWKQVFENCLGLAEGRPWVLMPEFKEGILKTVNESFDRDTAGAVAGALLGAYWGLRMMPEQWKESVYRAYAIIKNADELIKYAYLEPRGRKKNEKKDSPDKIYRFGSEVGFDVADDGIYCVDCYSRKYGPVIYMASCESIYDDPQEKESRRGTSRYFIGHYEVLPCSQCKRVILDLSGRENKKKEPSEEEVFEGQLIPSGTVMNVDEYLAAYLDYRSMKICVECFKIYGACIDREDFRSYYQKCHSTKPNIPPGEIKQEKWEWFDFNEIVTLCHCCGQEILNSGSKWSVWFCNECKKRVLDFHKKHQIWVSPIGRHPLMHGGGLSAQDARNKDERIKKFLFFWDKLSAAMNQLSKWHEHNMLNNFRTLGYREDVPLTDYLTRIRELSPKSQAFQGMFKFFGVPDELIPQV